MTPILQFMLMWLIPPVTNFFIVWIMLRWTKSYVTFEEKYQCIKFEVTQYIVILISTVVCAFIINHLNNDWTMGELFGYGIFEIIGSMLVGFCYNCLLSTAMSARNKNNFHRFKYSEDIDSYQVGDRLVFIHNDWRDEMGIYLLIVKNITDYTGSYNVFEVEHTFNNKKKDEITEEYLEKILSDYFKSSKLFNLNVEDSIVKVDLQISNKPKTIVIKGE